MLIFIMLVINTLCVEDLDLDPDLAPTKHIDPDLDLNPRS